MEMLVIGIVCLILTAFIGGPVQLILLIIGAVLTVVGLIRVLRSGV